MVLWLLSLYQITLEKNLVQFVAENLFPTCWTPFLPLVEAGVVLVTWALFLPAFKCGDHFNNTLKCSILIFPLYKSPVGSITSDDFCESQQNSNWLGLIKSVVNVIP